MNALSLVLSALALGIAIALLPFLPGLLGGAVLFVLVAPAHRRLRERIGDGASTIVVLLGTIALVLVPVVVLTLAAAAEAPRVLSSLTHGALPARVAALRIDDVMVGRELIRTGDALVTWISGQALHVIGGAARAVINLAIALTGLYYLLASGSAGWRAVVPYLPLSAVTAERLRRRFVEVTEAMLLGIGLTAVLQGTVVGLAFWLVGLPGAALWAAVTALASVFPLFGSALVWVPGVVVLLMEHRIGAAITLALIGAVVASNIDNVARLSVYRRVSGVHPMITLVGAFAGARIFGLFGVLLGPLAILYFLELVRVERESRRHVWRAGRAPGTMPGESGSAARAPASAAPESRGTVVITEEPSTRRA